jgi:dTDP-4-amino-4,6-dideoxygalactose transaminase
MNQKTTSKTDSAIDQGEYEQKFAGFIGKGTYAFPFWKGRVALFAILKALGIGPGDEVIVPGFTCVVVPNAVMFAGAAPIYVDNRPGTYHINPDQILAALSPRTKVILVQHTFGIPCPMDEVLEIARAKGLKLVEDSAHALGSTLNGKQNGIHGDAAFFSSQWSKPYTTGLGGIAATCNPELAEKIARVQQGFIHPPALARLKLFFQFLIYRAFFSPQNYWMAQGMLNSLSKLHLFVGSSSQSELEGQMPPDHYWKMPGFQQRVGLMALEKYVARIPQLQAIQKLYDRGLEEGGWPEAAYQPGTVMLRYPVEVANKDELLAKARQQHIELGSWFETPLHPTPLENHAHFGYHLGQCPNAERCARQVVNLPLNEWIKEKEAERVLKFFVKNARHPLG